MIILNKDSRRRWIMDSDLEKYRKMSMKEFSVLSLDEMAEYYAEESRETLRRNLLAEKARREAQAAAKAAREAEAAALPPE
ncbi:MAG: hypothetical protein LBL72_08075 [Candidatus Accumulibacter sp.]|jgi:hypothetical protein|nr:hypothetical protein [Accumulibacter sp.]